MTDLLHSRFLADFLFEFGAFFAIINPYGIAFIFLDRTVGLTQDERSRIARRTATYAFAVILVSAFAGSHVLNFFGISLPALRIAGGLVVAASGWSMLQADPPASTQRPPTATYDVVRQMAFYPFAIPLTTGPGTIATAITIGTAGQGGDNRIAAALSLVLAALAAAATIYHAYSRASAMARLLGTEGTSVITRLSAFLLVCIGVQIILTGVLEIAPKIAAAV